MTGVLFVYLKDNLLQAALAQERRRWHKEVELERNKAAEAAVAVAEVKWLEEEERKISEAIEQALQVARDSWQDEKAKNIGKQRGFNLCVSFLHLVNVSRHIHRQSELKAKGIDSVVYVFPRIAAAAAALGCDRLSDQLCVF